MSGTEDFDFQNTPASARAGTWSYLPATSGQVEPVVSIITPFFNPAAIFAETVLSVRRQSWQPWEWIIVDDGSTDALSLELLENLVQDEERVRVIHLQRNLGLSTARNRGLADAKGTFVAWLDADDLLEPTFLEKCLWRLSLSPFLAFTKGFSVGFGAKHYVWHNGFHDRERFLKSNRVDPLSVVRTEVCRAIGGFDEAIREGMEDWDFWLHAADLGYWGDTITEPLSWYRLRARHLDRWQNLKKDDKRETLEQTIRGRYPKLWAGAFPSIDGKNNPQKRFEPSALPPNLLHKRKSRVLFIVPHLELGGADRFNLDLIGQLGGRFGWEVTVVTTRRSGDAWHQKFYELTSDVFMLHCFLPFAAYPAFLTYLVESRQPDVVYLSQSELGYRLLPWLKATFPELPVVDLVHVVMDDWKDGGFPRFSRNARPWLARTVAISAELKRWLVAHGAAEDEVDVVYCNTDVRHWTRSAKLAAEARARWKIPEDRPIILYAARFCAQKNPEALPEIVRRLEAQKLDFVLLLVGDGPQRLWIEEHVGRAFPRSTQFIGPVEPDAMRLLMSAADLLVLPSHAEGIALVLYEALSMGVVPVATDVGGQRELITPECGVLVPADARVAETSALALASLLTNPDRRKQMAAAGRRLVETSFSLDAMGDRMDSIFKDVARKDGGRLKAQSAAPSDLMSRLAGDLMESESDDLGADGWQRKIRKGNRLLGIVSQSASWLRRSPARHWFRRFEIRYGDRLGKWLMRHV